MLGGEEVTEGGAPARRIEPVSNLRIRLTIRQLMDLMDSVGRRLQRIRAGAMAWHGQACHDARAPLDLDLDLPGAGDAIELYALNRETQQSVAFLIRRGRGRPDRRQILRQAADRRSLLGRQIPLGLLVGPLLRLLPLCAAFHSFVP